MDVHDETNVTLHCKIERETEKAILIKYNGSDVWLPKSQVRMNKDEGSEQVSLLIAGWLCEKHNIR